MREFNFGSTSASTTTGLTVAGATSLNMLMPAAAPSANIEFLGHRVGQTANATSAQQRIQLCTQVAAFPTTAVSVTPRPVKVGDATASLLVGATTIAAGKVGINIGTEGAGAKSLCWDDAFNVLNGFLRIYTPDDRDSIPAGTSSAFALWFPTAPTTLTGWNWTSTYREFM